MILPVLRFPGFYEGWNTKMLSDVIVHMDSGWSPLCESYPSGPDEWGVLKTTSTTWNGFDENENKKLPIKLKPRPRFEVKENDILITRAGPTERVGVVCHVGKVRQKLIISDKLIRIKADETISSKFLSIILSTPKAQNHLVSRKSGLASAQTNISQEILLKLTFNIPTTKEQNKIANFLTAIDEKIAQLTQKCDLLAQYKKGVMQQIFSQQLRFKGDDGQDFQDWEEFSFNELFYLANNKKTQVNSTNYLVAGKIPIVDQGQKNIVGYTNNETVYEDVPVIIFGDHTRLVKWIDFVFAPGADGTQVIKTTKTLVSKFGYYCLSNIELPNLGYSRHMKELKEIYFFVPSTIEEQTKIANFLTALDDKINHAQAQLAAIKQYKQGLLQQMFV